MSFDNFKKSFLDNILVIIVLPLLREERKVIVTVNKTLPITHNARVQNAVLFR